MDYSATVVIPHTLSNKNAAYVGGRGVSTRPEGYHTTTFIVNFCLLVGSRCPDLLQFTTFAEFL